MLDERSTSSSGEHSLRTIAGPSVSVLILFFCYSALGMGTFLFMIGAVFNTHQPDPKATTASGASIGMAVLIYLFVIPYCFSWGGLVWVYISELFDTRSRSYGIAFANASQVGLLSRRESLFHRPLTNSCLPFLQWLNNFAITRTTPLLVIAMNKGGIFFFFGALNMCNAIFSLWIPETIKVSSLSRSPSARSPILTVTHPASSQLSLEQVDIIFGSVSKEDRMRDITERFNAGAAGQAYNNKKGLHDDSSEVDMEKYNSDVIHQEDVRR